MKRAYAVFFKGPATGSMVMFGTKVSVRTATLLLHPDCTIEKVELFVGKARAHDARAIIRRISKNPENRLGILVDHTVDVDLGLAAS